MQLGYKREIDKVLNKKWRYGSGKPAKASQAVSRATQIASREREKKSETIPSDVDPVCVRGGMGLGRFGAAGGRTRCNENRDQH
jgi:hypothetical protein